MIPAWEAVLERAASTLAPGGVLHIVDFGTMDGLPGFARRAMLAWLAHFSVTPRTDLRAVTGAIAQRHGFDSSFHQGRFGYAAIAKIGRRP
jgi:S-adenosylmethionine-diacylgycerolhomoserine-N-methlytransferase